MCFILPRVLMQCIQRDNIINQFRLGNIWVLIATELMARGLDFKGVNLVINYDIPQTVASYIHRIGKLYCFFYHVIQKTNSII